MRQLILILILLLLPISSHAAYDDLVSCVKTCLDAGDSVTPTPEPTPTPTPTPSPTTKPFPDTITFDNTSDQGPVAGTACILFPASWAGKITAVTVNNEVATSGNSYKGRPTFYLSKAGDKYTRPLKFVITTTIGTYTASSETATDPVVGNNKETSKYGGSCGNPTGSNCRRNFRFSKPGSSYGSNIKVYLDGVLKMTVVDGSKRQQGSNGMIWKPVSDNNKKLVFVAEYGKKNSECTIIW